MDICVPTAPQAMARQPGEKFSDPRWKEGTWDFSMFKARPPPSPDTAHPHTSPVYSP